MILKFRNFGILSKTPHFLDLEIAPDGLSIIRKDTNTGLYTNFNNYVPWNHRKAWILSLVNRALKICCPLKLNEEIKSIQKFAAWNEFPKYIVNKIIKSVTQKTQQAQNDSTVNEPTTIWLRLNYAGSTGNKIVNDLKRRLRFCLKKNANVVYKVMYSTQKVSYYTNMKDRLSPMFSSNVVYKFTCPGCGSSYIGKTERNLYQRCKEHATTQTAVNHHLSSCSALHFLNNLFVLFLDNFNAREIKINLVKENTCIIDRSDNWNYLLLKEALHIKRNKPALNTGLKASKEFVLF